MESIINKINNSLCEKCSWLYYNQGYGHFCSFYTYGKKSRPRYTRLETIEFDITNKRCANNTIDDRIRLEIYVKENRKITLD